MTLAWIDEKLSRLQAHHLRRHLAERQGPQSVRISLNHRGLVNFGANDYLGLAADSRLAEAVRGAVERSGWGSGASPLVTGREQLHAALEVALAHFEGTQAALLFPSGFAANVGALSALVGKRDVVLSDARNHASIVDGCRLSGAQIQTYSHRNVDHLRSLLTQCNGFRRRLIVTDSLFSMDGDMAPLSTLAELAEEHRAMLMVDEAHATGVFGKSGRGICELFNVEQGVHVRVGTLSKALGGVGGFVAGSSALIDWLVNRARPYIYSTAPPAAISAAALAALKIVHEEPQRRRLLLQLAKQLHGRLLEQGWQLGQSESQIIPLIIKDPSRTMQLSAQLRRRGLLVPAIRPLSVPVSRSLLRISLCYGHDEETINHLAESLQKLARMP